MSFQPLSRRRQGLGPDGPYDGVPAHLRMPLGQWFLDTLSAGSAPVERYLEVLGVHLRLDLAPIIQDWSSTMKRANALLEHCERNPDLFLDLVDGTLRTARSSARAVNLEGLLRASASVWAVSPDGLELVERVSTEASEMYQEAAASSAPDAAEELRSAWSNAFGRNGDPSDAWDHAIKALEAALHLVIEPNNSKATLGTMMGVLRGNAAWRSSYPGGSDDNAIAPLLSAFGMIWANPDRHGSGKKRAPTEAEARSVVCLVVALVQAHNESPLVYKV